MKAGRKQTTHHDESHNRENLIATLPSNARRHQGARATPALGLYTTSCAKMSSRSPGQHGAPLFKGADPRGNPGELRPSAGLLSVAHSAAPRRGAAAGIAKCANLLRVLLFFFVGASLIAKTAAPVLEILKWLGYLRIQLCTRIP